MAATTGLRRFNFMGGREFERFGALSVLRGATWKPGWALAYHDGRVMPVPEGGWNNALTPTNGGPLQVPGADANGGLRVIASRAGVTLTITNAATVSVVVNYDAITLFCPVASTTAIVAKQLLLERANVSELIDVWFTGTGAGLVAALLATAVPCVRYYGISAAEVDNSASATDVAFLDAKPPMVAIVGIAPFVNDGGIVPGQVVSLIDNQTVARSRQPLCLQLRCIVVDAEYAYCEEC